MKNQLKKSLILLTTIVLVLALSTVTFTTTCSEISAPTDKDAGPVTYALTDKTMDSGDPDTDKDMDSGKKDDPDKLGV